MTISRIYRDNKPDCSHCGKSIEDAQDRVQHAGRVYHSERSPCREAYLKAGMRP